VSINPANRLHELEFALRQSETNVLVIGAGFKDADYAAMLQTLMPELADADPKSDVHAETLPQLRRIIGLGQPRPGLLSWNEFMAGARLQDETALRERQSELDFDEVINIQYTSGTTGFPKGAMLTHHNLVNNGYWIGERMRLTSQDRLCIPVPFYHCFGMVLSNLACVTHGATAPDTRSGHPGALHRASWSADHVHC
jgi:fatty-acyl-CoA synthase